MGLHARGGPRPVPVSRHGTNAAGPAMRESLRTKLLSKIGTQRTLRETDFTFDYEGFKCYFVPGSLFSVGERQEATTIERPANVFVGMTMGGGTYHTREGYKVRLAPGPVQAQEDLHANDENAIVGLFVKWIGILEEEVKAQPAIRRMHEIEAFVAQMRDDLDRIEEDAQFTQDEVDEVHERLDRLDNDIDVRIAAATGPLKEALETTKKEVEVLRGMLDTLPKKAWFRTAATRLAPFAAGTGSTVAKALIEAVVKVGFKLITEGPGA
jgi:hypothetical protein